MFIILIVKCHPLLYGSARVRFSQPESNIDANACTALNEFHATGKIVHLHLRAQPPVCSPLSSIFLMYNNDDLYMMELNPDSGSRSNHNTYPSYTEMVFGRRTPRVDFKKRSDESNNIIQQALIREITRADIESIHNFVTKEPAPAWRDSRPISSEGCFSPVDSPSPFVHPLAAVSSTNSPPNPTRRTDGTYGRTL